MSTDRFKWAEGEYLRLKDEFGAGNLNKEQFLASLKALVVRDEQGRAWMPGAATGKWYLLNGTSWQSADPYRTLPYAAKLGQAGAVPETPVQVSELSQSSTSELPAPTAPDVEIGTAAEIAKPSEVEEPVRVRVVNAPKAVEPIRKMAEDTRPAPFRTGASVEPSASASRSNFLLTIAAILLLLLLIIMIVGGLYFLSSQGVIKLS